MSDKAILDKLNTDQEYKNNPNMDDLKKHYQKINLQSNPDLQKKVDLEAFENNDKISENKINKINELYDIELNKDELELEKIIQLTDFQKKLNFLETMMV